MARTRGGNHTKRTTDELRKRIVNGELPGGTRLTELGLAEDLAISRTPIREAMSRLAEEGLLERVRGGGFVVRTFTLEDMIDAIELRGVLEGTAARIAAERGVAPANLAEIKRLLERLEGCFGGDAATMNFDAYSELNARFHDQLAESCASQVIQHELRRVALLPFASPSAFVMARPDDAASYRSLVVAQTQHHALVAAIERREGARAEAIAREHARIARSNLEAAFETGQPGPDTLSHLARYAEHG